MSPCTDIWLPRWAILISALQGAILVWQFAITLTLFRVRDLVLWVRDILLSTKQDQLNMTTQFANLQQAVDTLTATVNKEADIEASAVKVLASIPDLIQSAVNDALGKGAPPSTLSAFGTLNDVLVQKGAELAAAIANVPGQTPAFVTVPLIPEGGVTQADYVTDLTTGNLVVGTVSQADGAPTATPPGDVITTNPLPGASVAAGSAVDIVVAQSV